MLDLNVIFGTIGLYTGSSGAAKKALTNTTSG